MKIQSLGHVVLQVRSIEASRAFYSDLLGMPVVADMSEPSMLFYSLGNHHDFAIMEVGEDAESAPKNSPGLAHVAFKIGDSLDVLKAAKAELDEAGVRCMPVDHEVTKSLYFDDPDGNQVELYVDSSDAWKTEPQRVAQMSALEI